MDGSVFVGEKSISGSFFVVVFIDLPEQDGPSRTPWSCPFLRGTIRVGIGPFFSSFWKDPGTDLCRSPFHPPGTHYHVRKVHVCLYGRPDPRVRTVMCARHETMSLQPFQIFADKRHIDPSFSPGHDDYPGCVFHDHWYMVWFIFFPSWFTRGSPFVAWHAVPGQSPW